MMPQSLHPIYRSRYWCESPAWIICLLPLCALCFVRFGLGFDGLYGQDAHEYARYTAALTQWLETGTPAGWHAWPVGYTLLGALISSITGYTHLILQCISTCALIATGFAVLHTLDQLHGTPSDTAHTRRQRILWVVIAVILSPALWRAGILGMSDMLSIGLGSWAVALWCRLYRQPSSATLFGCAALALAAVGTRYGMAVLLLPFALHGLYLAIRHRLWTGLMLATLFTAGALYVHITIKASDADDLFQHYSLTLWSITNWWTLNVSTSDGIQHYRLPIMAYVFSALLRPSHLPLLLLLPFVRWHDLRQRQIQMMLLASIVYFLFLSGIPFQNPRFQMPVHPIAAIILYPAFTRSVAWLRRFSIYSHHKAFCLAVLMISIIGAQGVQTWRLLSGLLARNAFEYHVATVLRRYPARTLYTFDLDPALRTRGIPQKMENMWIKKIDTFQAGDFMLFAPSFLQKQWQGRTPMQNWHTANTQFYLKPQEHIGPHWILYELQPLAQQKNHNGTGA